MAINAIAVDIMLPAMPDILNGLNVLNENDQHYIISSYLISYGIAQIFLAQSVIDMGDANLCLLGLLFIHLRRLVVPL